MKSWAESLALHECHYAWPLPEKNSTTVHSTTPLSSPPLSSTFLPSPGCMIMPLSNLYTKTNLLLSVQRNTLHCQQACTCISTYTGFHLHRIIHVVTFVAVCTMPVDSAKISFSVHQAHEAWWCQIHVTRTVPAASNSLVELVPFRLLMQNVTKTTSVKQLKLQSLLHFGVIVLIWSARYNFILFGNHCSLALSAFSTSPKMRPISSSSVDKILVSFVDKWVCSSLGCDELHVVADWNDWLRKTQYNYIYTASNWMKPLENTVETWLCSCLNSCVFTFVFVNLAPHQHWFSALSRMSNRIFPSLVPRPPPFLFFSIILNENQRTKNGGGLGMRLDISLVTPSLLRLTALVATFLNSTPMHGTVASLWETLSYNGQFHLVRVLSLWFFSVCPRGVGPTKYVCPREIRNENLSPAMALL